MAKSENILLDHYEVLVNSTAYTNASSMDIKILLAEGSVVQSCTIKENDLKLNKTIKKGAKDSVELSLALSGERGDISIQFMFDDKSVFDAHIFAVKGQKGVYLSAASYESAELVRMSGDLSQADFIKEIAIKQGVKIPVTANISTRKATREPLARRINRIHFTWKDFQGTSHPLIGCKCEVISYRTGSILASGYTNESGNFITSLPSTSENLLLVYYTETQYIKVMPALNTNPYNFAETITSKTGIRIISINDGLQNAEFDTIRHAFEITQALYFGNKYAREMGGSTFNQSNIPVVYPNDRSDRDQTSYYSSTNNSLNIYKTAYLAWDIMLHEFGHLIQNHYGIANSPGGSHSSRTDLIEVKNNKSTGIRLAWGESWPTVFAIMVSQYYNLSSYPYVNDANYDANNGSTTPTEFWGYSLETKEIEPLGEGHERTIMQILYDMFDSAIEDGKDYMQMTHKQIWDIVTGSGATTLSEFAAKVYGSDLYYNDFGTIMSANNVAGKMHNMVGSKFNLSVGGNSRTSLSRQNKLSLAICSGYFGTSLGTISSTSFSPTGTANNVSLDIPSAMISKMFRDPGALVTARLTTWQTNTPVTGPYYTSWQSIRKPAHVNDMYLLDTSKFDFLGSRTSQTVLIDNMKVKLTGTNVEYAEPFVALNTFNNGKVSTIRVKLSKPCRGFSVIFHVENKKTSGKIPLEIAAAVLNNRNQAVKVKVESEPLSLKTANDPSISTRAITYLAAAKSGTFTEFIISVKATPRLGVPAYLLLGNIIIKTGTGLMVKELTADKNGKLPDLK